MKYPDFEKCLDGQIDALMDDWSKVSDDYFTTDGFYPYYTKQRYRVLVVARESRGLSGCDYIPILYDAYKQNRIAGRHINQNMFHRRLFFLIYGLLNGFPEWSEVPYPDQMTPTFATPDGISFAFMNISKISNESPNYPANWANIKRSMTDATSGDRNFIREEVALLAPDVIIGSGVDDLYRVLGDGELLSSGALISSYLLRISDKPVLFFSYKYHFTATQGAGHMGLPDEMGYYIPLKNAYAQFRHLIKK